MPMYLITDLLSPDTAMVEASRATEALNIYINDRFTVSPNLTAGQALRYSESGVRWISAGPEEPPVIGPETGDGEGDGEGARDEEQ